jgi:hypothetical protein
VRFGLLVCGLLWAAPVVAQRSGVRLEVAVDSAAASSAGPTITTGNLLADANTRELLRAGFATKIHYRLELWRKTSVFNDLSDRAEWDVFVQYDPTAQVYNVIRRQEKQLENFGGFATVTTAEEVFDRAFRAPLHPNRAGRFYYNLIVEVQPMLESDLDALQQWLRGPASPVKSGFVLAIRSGVGRLMSRILGGDKQHYEVRSGVFSVP